MKPETLRNGAATKLTPNTEPKSSEQRETAGKERSKEKSKPLNALKIVSMIEKVCGDAEGTVAGYGRHRYRKQHPCDPCRLAHNEYLRDRAQEKPLPKGKDRRQAREVDGEFVCGELSGTGGGESRHRRAGEKPCEACAAGARDRKRVEAAKVKADPVASAILLAERQSVRAEKMKDPAARQAERDYDRKRYHQRRENDPEWYENKKAYGKAYGRKRRANPAIYEADRKVQKKRRDDHKDGLNAERRLRRRNDPEYAEKDRQRKRDARKRDAARKRRQIEEAEATKTGMTTDD